MSQSAPPFKICAGLIWWYVSHHIIQNLVIFNFWMLCFSIHLIVRSWNSITINLRRYNKDSKNLFRKQNSDCDEWVVVYCLSYYRNILLFATCMMDGLIVVLIDGLNVVSTVCFISLLIVELILHAMYTQPHSHTLTPSHSLSLSHSLSHSLSLPRDPVIIGWVRTKKTVKNTTSLRVHNSEVVCVITVHMCHVM